ncbi:MAG: hypothetical protein ACJ74O_15100 [Frankiaceae bacterium]
MKKTLIAGIAVSVLAAGVPFSPAVASAQVVPASSPSAGELTLVIGSGWSDSERAVLKKWTASASPELTALEQVVGPPGQDETVTVSKAPGLNSQHAYVTGGEYSVSGHRIVLTKLALPAFMHELDHAVHDRWMLSDSVWEEGLAQAAEVVEMDRLAAEGIPLAQGYQDLHHRSTWDQYYENENVPEIAVGTGSIFDNGNSVGGAYRRYVQAGYAFGKILFRNPRFISRFDALLLQHPDGALAPSTLEAMAGSIAHWVEARRFPVWVRRQHILDTAPPAGCRLLHEVTGYTVYFFCRSSTGLETPRAGARVTLDAVGANGELVFHDWADTYDDGSAMFSNCSRCTYHGRVRFVASVTTPDGTVLARSTAARQAAWYPAPTTIGLFGVVRNASSGVVVLSSPVGRFTRFAVPVTNGAFATQRLAGFAGRVIASFTGEGRTTTRLFVKDASPYSVVLSARASA